MAVFCFISNACGDGYAGLRYLEATRKRLWERIRYLCKGFQSFLSGSRRGRLEVQAFPATVFPVITIGPMGSTDIAPAIAAELASKTIRAGIFFVVPGYFFRYINLPGHARHFHKRHGSPWGSMVSP